jgi:hypothetical protein
MLATTIVAVSAAFWPRHAEPIEILVDSFNRSIQDHRYEETERIAARACHFYPDEPVSKQMDTVCKLLRKANPNK